MSRPAAPFVAAVAVLALCLPLAVIAQGIRYVRPVPTPPPKEATEPSGGTGSTGQKPTFRLVTRAAVETPIRQLIDAWNRRDLRDLWSDGTFDQARYPDLLALDVPRDARLRLLAIEGVTTLDQSTIRDDPDSPTFELESIVSVTVRTQLEYNHPTLGLQRLDGVNEYLLAVTEQVPR